MKVDISIIIVNWNTREYLQQCLRSIYAAASNLAFETIVVDNASKDGSAKMVTANFPQVILITNDTNKGFAAANNQGIARATGQYILLLNSDTIVLDNAIENCLAFARANPDAAVIGLAVLNPDRTVQPTCFMFPSILNMLLSTSYLYKLFPHSKFFGRERMTWWNRSDIRQVDVVTGCFMLVNRKAIQQVGLMDERFFLYAEETDWCYRFKQAGWKVLFAPVGHIVHFGGQSARHVPAETILQVRAGILQFFKKHRSRAEYYLACVLVWLFFALRLPVWFVKSLTPDPHQRYSRIRLTAYAKGMKQLMTKGPAGLCSRITGPA